MLEQLLKYDTELFLFLNNLGSGTWDGFWLVITHKFTFVPLYVFLCYLLYKKFGLKSVLTIALLVGIMIVFTDQMANVFKRGFERPRPCGVADLMDKIRFIAVRCGKYGFFSAHSANTMALAIFIGLTLKPYYKHLIVLLFLWSLFVAYSRIYVGVHYPLDVICGLIFGAISGYAFFKLAQYFLNRYVDNKPR